MQIHLYSIKVALKNHLAENTYTVKKIFLRFVITTFFLLSNQLK